MLLEEKVDYLSDHNKQSNVFVASWASLTQAQIKPLFEIMKSIGISVQSSSLLTVIDGDKGKKKPTLN